MDDGVMDDGAMAIRVAFPRGCVQVVECDIRDFFGSIDHARLLDAVRRRVSDRRVVKLVRLWLQAGVMEDGRFSETVSGTPQGGVISPLLANIYLHALDETWERHGRGELVRYADDLVALCRTRDEAEAALVMMRTTLTGLGLELHPEKTRIVDLSEGREGFDFLGCHFRARVSGRLLERGIRRYYLQRRPFRELVWATRGRRFESGLPENVPLLTITSYSRSRLIRRRTTAAHLPSGEGDNQSG